MNDVVAAAETPGIAPEGPPLRVMVLSGRFFGPGHGKAAARLSDFLAEPTEEAWFGAGQRGDLRVGLDRDIAAIDFAIARQLDAILHAPRQRRLEGMWRGLAWMLGGVEPGARVKVRLLAVAWSEIARDLERAAEFDQSNLFRRIYEDEFGTPGGEPYGLLVIDHELRHAPAPGAPADDPAAVAALASIAAPAFTPAVLAASPTLLDVDGWADLVMTAEPASAIGNAAHARWRRLGGREDMRFVGVLMPPVLARVPWTDDPARHDGFLYRERVRGVEERVWMSPCYAFAATVIRAFTRFGWPADLRGVDIDREGGGLVTRLPTEDWSTERQPVWPRTPISFTLNDRQERSVVEGGLMPLAALPFTNDGAFVAMRSLQVPKLYAGETGEAASANARLSAQFNAILCVSRFAHYVKVIGRDMVGAITTDTDIQRRLDAWIKRYVNSNAIAGPEGRARAPLLEGHVSVSERAGKPGSFDCVISLKPHFQLDGVSATFRLVTEITAPGRAA